MKIYYIITSLIINLVQVTKFYLFIHILAFYKLRLRISLFDFFFIFYICTEFISQMLQYTASHYIKIKSCDAIYLFIY